MLYFLLLLFTLSSWWIGRSDRLGVRSGIFYFWLSFSLWDLTGSEPGGLLGGDDDNDSR